MEKYACFGFCLYVTVKEEMWIKPAKLHLHQESGSFILFSDVQNKRLGVFSCHIIIYCCVKSYVICIGMEDKPIFINRIHESKSKNSDGDQNTQIINLQEWESIPHYSIKSRVKDACTSHINICTDCLWIPFCDGWLVLAGNAQVQLIKLMTVFHLIVLVSNYW